ncbi:cell division protein ZapA [Xenophilus arseniciresistens]|uniref:Cell division protein ZapA n=1 Tax=Xenophilus arseniciresistens TaxID=1283306 RepID=A0AAE3SZV3_9BURK|nr:cell division protein ZapA [Xenophilus arseniciresistens]MDA7415642.1 cell division protein ZapA [Xenophilus arseniciresistens]
MNQIEVQIMGQSYLLGCPPDGEAQLREAVARVDAAMCGIRDAGKVKARDRIAVLASLNLAFDLAQRDQDLAAAQAALAEEKAKAEAAGSAPAPAASSGGPLLSYTSTVAGSADARSSQLIERLDQVLSSDGRLF